MDRLVDGDTITAFSSTFMIQEEEQVLTEEEEDILDFVIDDAFDDLPLINIEDDEEEE